MQGMTDIVKTVTRIIVGLIFIYGIYIIVYGHLTPGGGFAGGAIVAGAFILLVLAYGVDVLKLKKEEEESSISEDIAILLFLLMALGGITLGAKVFFSNYLPKGKVGELISGGVIPLYDIAVGIEVAAAILAIFLALVIYEEEIL
jgi:multicomponent Na+:H+ antiporter subunit B